MSIHVISFSVHDAYQIVFQISRLKSSTDVRTKQTWEEKLVTEEVTKTKTKLQWTQMDGWDHPLAGGSRMEDTSGTIVAFW